MRLTNKSRYGTRLILDIALHGQKGQPVRLGDIAERQGFSLKYLEKLIRNLKKAGLIISRRGPTGGHMLARKPEEITVGQIVRALEVTPDLTCCEDTDPMCGVCNRAGDCLTRWIWVEVNNTLFNMLDKLTIADVMEGPDKFLKDEQ